MKTIFLVEVVEIYKEEPFKFFKSFFFKNFTSYLGYIETAAGSGTILQNCIFLQYIHS